MCLQDCQTAIHLHIQYAILSSCLPNINSKYNYDSLIIIITYIVILHLHFKALLYLLTHNCLDTQ